MDKYLISRNMRLFFAVSGSVLWLGIWLTGFGTVHWLLYVPAGFFAFAALTGICPGMILLNIIMRGRQETAERTAKR